MSSSPQLTASNRTSAAPYSNLPLLAAPPEHDVDDDQMNGSANVSRKGSERETEMTITLRKAKVDKSGYESLPASNGSDEVDEKNPSVDESVLAPDYKQLGVTKDLGEPVVIVKNLGKQYQLADREENVIALKDINLTHNSEFYPILKGELVMIRGPSGGGKTTLLNILGTIDYPTSGEVSIFGDTMDRSSSDAYLANLRLRRIGFVFQTFNLLATLSAFENVELPMLIAGQRDEKERKRRAKQLLDMVGLQDRYGHLPSELSGGEQQRVTIARALCNDPDLLLLDEPTGDLDTRNTVDVMDLLLAINQQRKTTMIMVTHNPDLEPYADRILYIQDGIIQRQSVNRRQRKLDYHKYLAYMNEQQHQHEVREKKVLAAATKSAKAKKSGLKTPTLAAQPPPM